MPGLPSSAGPHVFPSACRQVDAGAKRPRIVDAAGTRSTRSMGSKRSMILVVALLIGGIAAFALYNYVNGVEDKALQGTEQVTVYWVQAPISANTQGEQVIGSKMIVTKQVPANLRPPTAITDLSTIKGKVAKTDLAIGQIVVPGMFVDQSQAASTWTERLPVDRVAIQVSL